jgi:hypothetical protein
MMPCPSRRRVAVWSLAVLAAAALLGDGSAWAQQLTLQINPKRATFNSADPDTVPVVTAQPIIVTYRVRNNGNGPWRITLLAEGDLVDGLSTIDISHVTWAATPAPPFQGGTLSKTVEQVLASGTGGVNPAKQASVVFQLANSWNYSTGQYTQTIVFTLSAP